MYGYVYMTTNLVTGDRYIGRHKSSLYDHKYLGSGDKLLKAVDEYGIDCFTNFILCRCSSNRDLNEKEKEMILLHNPEYNMKIGGGSHTEVSEETRKKLSAFRTGRKQRKETVEKRTKSIKRLYQKGMKAPWQGRKHSEESIKKMSEAKKGKVLTQETKDKISRKVKEQYADGRTNSFLGKAHSEQTKKAISDAKKGKKGVPHTEEWKKMMSERMKGDNNPMRRRNNG